MKNIGRKKTRIGKTQISAWISDDVLVKVDAYKARYGLTLTQAVEDLLRRGAQRAHHLMKEAHI